MLIVKLLLIYSFKDLIWITFGSSLESLGLSQWVSGSSGSMLVTRLQC